MMSLSLLERRQPLAAQHTCPWCHGRLTIRASISLAELVPGGIQTKADETLPADFQWFPAMVCATPHCRYRAVLRPVTPALRSA
jgi:hypothetical protein